MPQSFELVINCGSSSIKLALLDPETSEVAWSALGERLGTDRARLVVTPAGGPARPITLPLTGYEPALNAAMAALPPLPISGVGHRVVHGGERFTESVVLDSKTIAAIEEISHLAPLHNPANLTGIRVVQRRRPELGQVAVFDTAFHHTMPARAHLYALPYALYEQHKVRRYGFHGTSHRYVAERAAELLRKPLDLVNLVTVHLGNGASATAIRAGRSVDTTMGFTPLEGLVMGTRCGDVDPGLHQFLVDHAGMTLDEVTDMLNRQSGLLGLSGESNDMRTLLELEAEGHSRANLAIEVFCYRLSKAILSLSAALPTIDAIVFTGGIGENAARIRERTARMLGVLGVRLDARLNDEHGHQSRGTISEVGKSRIEVLVIPTNEELVIAREARRLLSQART